MLPEQSLATQGDEERMTTSRDAYPAEPRIIAACSLIEVQSGIIGMGRRAIRDKRQAAREKCCKYSWKHRESVRDGSINAWMKRLLWHEMKMIGGGISICTTFVRKSCVISRPQTFGVLESARWMYECLWRFPRFSVQRINGMRRWYDDDAQTGRSDRYQASLALIYNSRARGDRGRLVIRLAECIVQDSPVCKEALGYML